MIRSQLAAAGLFLAALLAPDLDANAATSPFLTMAGTWSGGGTITMASGIRTRRLLSESQFAGSATE